MTATAPKLNKTQQSIMTQIELHGRTFMAADRWGSTGIRQENAFHDLMERGIIERDGRRPDDIQEWKYFCLKGKAQTYSAEWDAHYTADREARRAQMTIEQRAEQDLYEQIRERAIEENLSYEEFQARLHAAESEAA